MGASYYRPMPRPGARAAKRRARLETYEPRFQLQFGHDPWALTDRAAVSGDFEPLDDWELAALGLKPRAPEA